MNKTVVTILALSISLNVWAQGPKQQVIPGMSKSMEDCVAPGEVGHFTLKDGQLICDDNGTILYVQGLEYQTGNKVRSQLIKPTADGTLPAINNAIGKINAPSPVTFDNQKVQKVSTVKDYTENNGKGTDLYLDRFVLERGGKIVRIYNGNKVPEAKGKAIGMAFQDGRTTNTVEDKDGNDAAIKNASQYSFPTLALIDETNAQKYKDEDAIWYLNKLADVKVKDQPVVTQMMIPGPYVCTKPKVLGNLFGHEWNFWMSRTRPYVKIDEPVNYCYQELGIDLPPLFKDSTDDSATLAILLVLPYSEKAPDGKREDDNMAIWTSISKADYDKADYIVLSFGVGSTFSRGIITLVKEEHTWGDD